MKAKIIKNLFEIKNELENSDVVVALPTDTVWGIVANAKNTNAIKKIYDIKKRDIKKPIGLFVGTIDKLLKNDIILSNANIDIINKYSPGAITYIVEDTSDHFFYLTNNAKTISFRIPNTIYILEFLRSVDFILAQTSLNISGEEPLTNINEVIDVFGEKVDYIVDADIFISNKSSTILDLIHNKIIREGDVKVE